MANKEAVFTVKVNTGNSVQDLQNADKAVQQLGQDLQKTQNVAKDSSGTDAMAQKLAELDARLEAGGLSMREMTKTMKEYQTIALQAGVESPVGMQALQNASALKDEIGDLKAQTTALASDFVKLDTATAGIEVGAQAFMGFQSVMALAGSESEELVQTMVKLQAVQGLVNSVTTIANKLNSDSILGIQVRNGLTKLQSWLLGANTAQTTATTTATTGLATAQGAVTSATNASSTAMKGLRMAMLATGIGALIAGVILLVQNLDRIKLAMGGTTQAQKDLVEAQKEGAKAMAEAKTQVNEVDLAFRQAKEGVISKEQALKVYNEKLGATLGTTDNYNLAEKTFRDNTAKYIKAVQARATAQALANKAAEEFAKGQVAALEDQTSAAENAGGLLELYVEGNLLNEEAAAEKRQKIQSDAVAKIQQKAQKSYDELNKLSEKYLEDALKLESELNTTKEKVEKASTKKSNKSAEDKRKAEIEATKKAHQKSLEDLKKHNEQLLNEEEANAESIRRSKMSARDLELSDIQDEYFEKRTQAEKLGAEGVELVAKLTAEEELKKAEVRKKYADAELQAQAQREAKRRERQNFLDEINLNDQEKALKDVSEKFDESKKELLRRLNSSNEDERITQEEFNNALIALEQKKADKILEINKEASEKAKAQQQKDREESLKGVTDFLANSQMVLDHVKTVNNLINEIDQARLNKLTETRDEDLANLEAKMKAELNAEGVTAEQKKQIEEKFAQQKYQVQLQAYNAEEKIRKQQFIRDKAIKLSQIAIDTASAIVKAIAQYGPPPSPMGIAGIASASIIGITQALAVANQQYKAGSAPSAPNISTGGGAMTGASASSFSSAPTATTSTAGLTEQGTPTPTTTSTQVYVLESDISNTQNKVKLQEAKTSF